MATKFYKEAATGLWRLGDYIIPPANATLRLNSSTNITIKVDVDLFVYSLPDGITGDYSDFTNEAGNPYASLNALLTANKDFFFEVSAEPSFTTITIGGTSNYLTIDENGNLRLGGGATYWRDIDFPIITRTAVTNQPTPTTLALSIQAPVWAVNDFYNCDGQELVHEWKEGSTCYWHCHLITNGVDVADRYVKFELQYAYADVNGVLVSDTITTADITIPANTADRTMKIVSIGNFTPSTNKIATHVYARLKRVASTGTAPTNNPFIPMLQMHIECDSLGSDAMTSKEDV
jgi:hypothetical protein